jgi:hypothetical protein
MFKGAYILGGLGSRSVDGLVAALIRDAKEADSQPPASERSRHVNTAELQQIAQRILSALPPAPSASTPERTE